MLFCLMDKELTVLIHKMSFCIIIYPSYKLLKRSSCFIHLYSKKTTIYILVIVVVFVEMAVLQ